MRYHDGFIYLSWCAVPDGSVTQRSLCSSLTAMVRVRVLLGSYFFSKFLQLEFYLFRNYERNHDLSHFWSKKIVLSLFIEYALQISFTSLNFFMENSGHVLCLHVKLEILWQAQLCFTEYVVRKIINYLCPATKPGTSKSQEHEELL